MTASNTPDLYELLQVSPRADRDTIERVFRHLAKRFHPDNQETGDSARFQEVLDAFRVLSDPEQRARYDVAYEGQREIEWRVFDQESTLDGIVADRRVRSALLALLYSARRNDADHPGIGVVDLERLLGCPEEHIRFHVWYLREKGYMQRLENGMWAITAAGVDQVLDSGSTAHQNVPLLKASSSNR